MSLIIYLHQLELLIYVICYISLDFIPLQPSFIYFPLLTSSSPYSSFMELSRKKQNDVINKSLFVSVVFVCEHILQTRFIFGFARFGPGDFNQRDNSCAFKKANCNLARKVKIYDCLIQKSSRSLLNIELYPSLKNLFVL